MLHSFIIGLVECHRSILSVHKGAPQTTVKADPGCALGFWWGYFCCFLLYFLVSLDCVVQGVFSPVVFLPQLPKYWMANTCHCAQYSANFSHS